MLANITNSITNLDKNSRFLLIIIFIISFLLVLIYFINFLSNRKIRKHTRLQKKLINEINREAKTITTFKEDFKKKANTVNETISVKEEQLEVLDDEEEIIEVLKDDEVSDVDRILNDIKEASKEESMNLTEFEREQEETAIISYDELCKRAGVKKKVYKTSEVKEPEVVKVEPVKEQPKTKYKPSRVVSPIFGVQNEQKQVDDDLDKTFLQSLKEFRSSLN